MNSSEPPWKPTFVDTELEFTKFVQSFHGGKTLSDYLGAIPNGYLNADYFIEVDQVIIELKCLSEDGGDAEIQAKRLAESARHFGYSGSDVFGWTWRGEPVPHRIAQHIFNKKIRTVVEALKKANKQIRSTKLLLGIPRARGLIALANDNNFGLAPKEAMSALVKAFRSMEDCHTDCIVYFTPNVFHDMGDGIAHTLWFPLYNVGSEPFGDFVNEFGTSWGDYLHANVQPILSRRKGDNQELNESVFSSRLIPQLRKPKH